MYTEHVSPKLLLQFYKGQKVPPLVKKYDFQAYNTQQTARQRRRMSKHSAHSMKTHNGNISNFYTNELSEISIQLDRQIEQNRQLRLIIKQMEQKILKLKQINSELVYKVQQFQKVMVNMSEASDLSKRQIIKRARIQVYKQVQQYLKIQSQKFTDSLLNVKMNPVIENKIQQFLQQIISINSISVRKALQEISYPRQRRLFDQQQANRTIKEIVQKHSKSKSKQKQKQKSREKSRELDALRYQMVLQKLSNQNQQLRPGIIIDRSNSPGKWKSDTKGKRPPIFRKNHDYNQRSISRDRMKIQF